MPFSLRKHAHAVYRDILNQYIYNLILYRVGLMKTKAQISFAVTAKLISAFVFATRIVQFLLYLTPKFQASSLLLCLYRSVCVGPVRKPHCWFSHEAAQLYATSTIPRVVFHYHCLKHITRSHICDWFHLLFGTCTLSDNKVQFHNTSRIVMLDASIWI